MAYTNPRTLSIDDIGDEFLTLAQCTLADYTVAGTVTPVVGDLVTPTNTGNWYVARAADNTAKYLGFVTKIELAPTGTGIGQIVVRWLDGIRQIVFDCDDMSTVTLLDSAIKDGSTAVAGNMDAGATTGNLIVVAKSGTTGAGTGAAILFAA